MEFVDEADDDGPANIWVAASDGDIARVKELIDSGTAVNGKDDNGYSPIHAAASYGELPMVTYLLSVGGDVHLRDDDGDTPLLVCETPAMFELLVAAGADPEAENATGMKILNKAVEDENEEMIDYLQEKGYITDPNFTYTPASEVDLQQMLAGVMEGDEEGEEGEEGEGEEQMQS